MKERHKEKQGKEQPKTKQPEPQRRKEGWDKGATENTERRRGTERDVREPAKRPPGGDVE